MLTGFWAAAAGAMLPGYRAALEAQQRREVAWGKLRQLHTLCCPHVSWITFAEEVERRQQMYADCAYRREPELDDEVAAVESLARDIQAGVVG